MGTVLSVVSVKGGVGKSTISSYVAMELAEQGYQVCVLDLCQNSSIATAFLQNRDDFNVSAYHWLTGEAKFSEVVQEYNDNLAFIPSNEQIDDFKGFVEKEIKITKQLTVLDEKISAIKDYFDYIIIDTHPSENDTLVSYALIASDYALIPFEVDEDSRLAVNRTVEVLNEFIESNHLTGYFIIGNKIDRTKRNMVTNYKNLKDKFILDGIREEAFISTIRASSLLPSTKLEKNSLYDKKDNKYAKAVLDDFKKVTDDILTNIEKGSQHGK